MNTKKAIIFDMDGVIFDSERAAYGVWKEVAEKHGFAWGIDEVYPKVIGVNANYAKLKFLEQFGEDFPYDEYRAERRALFTEKYSGGRLPVKKGVKELLTWLKNAGFSTAIASSTWSPQVRQQITDAGFLPYFDRIIGGEMVSKSKPEPDIFLKAAEEWDIPVSEIFVIEDSFNGIRAASKAKMIPVMVPDMLQPDDEIKGLAKVILPDLTAVKEYLAGLEK